MTDIPLKWLTLVQVDQVKAGAAGAAEEAAAAGPETWQVLLVLFSVFVVPFVLGTLIARLLKLKDVGGRIGVVLFAASFGVMPFAWQVLRGNEWHNAIPLGIDLAGGTNLLYEIDVEEAEADGKEVNAELMKQMVNAIRRRLDPAAQEQITVLVVGTNRIEVIIPGADPEVVRQKKSRMTQLGKLEFTILATRRRHADIIEKAEANEDKVNVRMGGRIAASWRRVGVDRQGKEKDIDDLRGEVVTREVVVGGKTFKEFLVILEPLEKRVTGRYLKKARSQRDNKGRLAVGFDFNTRGGYLFQTLTAAHNPLPDGFEFRLGVLLDDKLHSAPGLLSTISDSGQITGDFDQEEIDELVGVLNAGALEAPIKHDPITELTISPTLGKDVRNKGMLAISIAAVLVLGFMLFYYRFAGLVADLCLVLNMILVMGGMAIAQATFTLPGLAAIVLTIGMAVDANVLIFERIREETQRGSSLRMAIHNGFSKALRTIVDANVTTLITAVVLYMIGTDQVRGFAVTLFIGIVMSMFTALFFGRLMFDIVERKRWLTELKMFSIIGKTEWKFLSKRVMAGVVSITLILVGMGALFSRGSDNLDIDFTGGIMVKFQVVKVPDDIDIKDDRLIDDIRGILQERMGTGITLEALEELSGDGDEQKADTGLLFRLRTKVEDMDKVRDDLNLSLFARGYELRRVEMDFQIKGVEKSTVSSGKEQEKSETETDEPEPASEDLFAEFTNVSFEFTGVIATSTVQDYLKEELAKIKNEQGYPKYDQIDQLLSLKGTAGPGMTAEKGEAKRFTAMSLKASSVVTQDDLKASLILMKTKLANEPLFEEVNTFASRVGDEMQISALAAIFFSLIAIVGYLWLRFKQVTFGLAAVVALVHDVLIVLGLVALASLVAGTGFGQMLNLNDFKINLPMIAAFLTIVGYSLNDTIVVFDRIREVRGKNPALTEVMVNTSLNQTLSRTILTSLTTFIVVFILYAFGGEGIHGFAFCLVLGVIVGTYSSIFVASPVLLWLMNRPGSEAVMATAAGRRKPAATAG